MNKTSYKKLKSHKTALYMTYVNYSGRSPAGQEAWPAAAIVNSPMCARTGLPLLTSA